MSAPVDSGVQAGDVRLVDGVPALVLRPWDGHEPGDEDPEERTWICAPVKEFPESGEDSDVTGECVIAEGSWVETGWGSFGDWYAGWLNHEPLTPGDPDNKLGIAGIAMPLLAGTVEQKFIGKLLFRVHPQHHAKALNAWHAQFRDGKKAEWDYASSPYSDSDWELSHRMTAKTLESLLYGDEESNDGGR